MLTIRIKQGKGIPFIRRGRHRWFAVNEKGVTRLQFSMPRSFATRPGSLGTRGVGPVGRPVLQCAWENANDPNDLFEQHATETRLSPTRS